MTAGRPARARAETVDRLLDGEAVGLPRETTADRQGTVPVHRQLRSG